MEGWIMELLAEYGYYGVLALILVENLFPPIPSELILTFSGFLVASHGLSMGWMIVAATTGSVIGAMMLYGIGMFLDVPRLERLTDRYGRWLRLKRKDIRRADAWFHKYGPWTVLICRVIPLVRSLISIPAGMSGMNFPLFILLTTLGSLVWNSVLIFTGVKLGSHFESVIRYMDIYSNVVYILIGIGGVAACMWYVRLRRKRVY
ncbi:DedA family protein [Sporosarcina gallistercoris]|uniref:DedA family protein n=1 Tax=Sporosarcina gallistercoris TaxID=2762245 RepID=A0ABR8PKN6_9BACL|nr:DedA family protein [Sporosarcina gallistercoris]MBD7908734.1 DedA family protein [Sporosarcina gallistercoris]